MSMPLSNALQSQIITDNHFLHHPKVDNELTRNYGYCHEQEAEDRYFPYPGELVHIYVLTHCRH